VAFLLVVLHIRVAQEADYHPHDYYHSYYGHGARIGPDIIQYLLRCAEKLIGLFKELFSGDLFGGHCATSWLPGVNSVWLDHGPWNTVCPIQRVHAPFRWTRLIMHGGMGKAEGSKSKKMDN
jgi:hypothetical protein